MYWPSAIGYKALGVTVLHYQPSSLQLLSTYMIKIEVTMSLSERLNSQFDLVVCTGNATGRNSSYMILVYLADVRCHVECHF